MKEVNLSQTMLRTAAACMRIHPDIEWAVRGANVTVGSRVTHPVKMQIYWYVLRAVVRLP